MLIMTGIDNFDEKTVDRNYVKKSTPGYANAKCARLGSATKTSQSEWDLRDDAF